MLMAGGSGNSPQHRFALICLSQLVVHNLSAAQIKSLKMRFSSVLIPRISIPQRLVVPLIFRTLQILHCILLQY